MLDWWSSTRMVSREIIQRGYVVNMIDLCDITFFLLWATDQKNKSTQVIFFCWRLAIIVPYSRYGSRRLEWSYANADVLSLFLRRPFFFVWADTSTPWCPVIRRSSLWRPSFVAAVTRRWIIIDRRELSRTTSIKTPLPYPCFHHPVSINRITHFRLRGSNSLILEGGPFF